MLDKIAPTIPKPGAETISRLLQKVAPPGAWHTPNPPEWLVKVITIAYQSGRYDEASTETFAESLR